MSSGMMFKREVVGLARYETLEDANDRVSAMTAKRPIRFMREP
jgi:hypothetical protein